MPFRSVTFDISPQVLELGVRVVVFSMGGLEVPPSSPPVEAYKAESCQAILPELSEASIRQDPILQGFRALHTRLGFSNRAFPAASEALLEYLLRQRRLPAINPLVDLYNLVSVETRLSLGAHDLAKVTGNIHLRLTTGSEGFWPLGAGGPKPVRPGAYAYCDDANDVLCLLEVKQVQKTPVTLQTGDCLFIVQGNPATGPGYLQAAADRLAALVQRTCGGEVKHLAQRLF